MIKKALIAVCVLILLAAAAHQFSQSSAQRSNYEQTMNEQRLKTLAKREELASDLEAVRSKPNPSDHDRWLMEHLAKSIAGLDAVLVTMDAGQRRMEHQSVRTWAGMGGVLLAFAVFGLGFSNRADVRLTEEERALLQRSLSSIDGIKLAPESYHSHAAPVSSGANFVTGRIRQQDATTLKIRTGRMVKAFAAAFIIGPATYLAVDVGYLVSDVLERGMDAEFSSIKHSLVLVAGFGIGVIMMLAPRISSITVDRQLQVIRFPDDKSDIPFRDIAAIQLNDVLVTGKRTFQNHQIQLNLKNGQHRSLLNHAGRDQMTVDLIQLARFTGLPIAVPANGL